MSRRRQERVTELIHQEISKRIPLLKDPGLGFITILGVRLSPDFTQAKVFYSVLGTEEERERTRVALEKCKAFFRAQLYALENLKMAPELTFLYDNSAEEAQRVLNVLSKLEKERTSQAEQPKSFDKAAPSFPRKRESRDVDDGGPPSSTNPADGPAGRVEGPLPRG